MKCPKCKDIDLVWKYEGEWNENESHQAKWKSEEEVNKSLPTCSSMSFAGGQWVTPPGFVGSIDMHGRMSPSKKFSCPKCGLSYSASAGCIIAPPGDKEPELAEHIKKYYTSKWQTPNSDISKKPSTLWKWLFRTK